MCLQDSDVLRRLVCKPCILIVGLCIFCSVIFPYFYYLCTSSSSWQFTEPFRDVDIIIEGDMKLFAFKDADGEPHKVDDTVARKLAEEVRVLCWVMTWPENHEEKARHVKRTWGRRCNILLFMSTANDSTLPAIQLPVKEGREYLWGKTKEAFRYVYRHHLHQADWFLKTDDDTYVIVENLRYMLSAHKPNEPVYFGCHVMSRAKQGYMSGGAGYVLSRDAVRLLVENGLPDKKKCCPRDVGNEDMEMGKCLKNVGVKAGDSRDAFGRGRFFPYILYHHMHPGSHINCWYWNRTYYKSKESMGCCSDTAVSFHHVLPFEMYLLEYFIYHLHPYGISHYVKKMAVTELPPPLQENRTTKKVEALTKSKER